MAENQEQNNQSQYVFRLHTKGMCSEVINTGWGKSTVINTDAINSIQDTEDVKTEKRITSIPSPFAKLDLALQAFKYVIEHNLVGNTVYHKIVSACLDVGQIFFMFDDEKIKSRFTLHSWGSANLSHLANARNTRHSKFAKTLELFAEQDKYGTSGNQQQLIDFKFHILEYTGDEATQYGNFVIGGTSPYTLFAAVNETIGKRGLNELKFRADSGEDTMFDESPKSLQERSLDFIKYLWWLKEQAKSLMPQEVITYIEKSKNNLDLSKRQQIDKIKFNTKPEDIDLSPFIYEGKTIELFEGVPLYKRAVPPAYRNFLSEKIIFTKGDLTGSDGNETFILLNKDDKQLAGYLLPIKKEFFKYHTLEKLQDERIFKAKVLASDSVNCQLNFNAEYSYPNNRYDKNNDIERISFFPLIFPHIKYSNDNIAMYRAAFISSSKDVEMSFYTFEGIKKDSQIESKAIVKQHYDYFIKVYDLKENFDFIVVNYNGCENILIPKFSKECGNGNRSFCFAIDFGTTNTHIAYSINGDSRYIKSFDIDNNNLQFYMTTGLAEDEARGIIDNEFMPTPGTCGIEDSSFHFPIRTVLSAVKGTNWTSGNPLPFKNAACYFNFEKSKSPEYNESPKTNLKWNPKPDGKNMVKAFLGSLSYMIRNKVLLEGGDLKQTKIMWFYPASMAVKLVNNLTDTWRDVYKAYFGEDENNIFCISESIAPWISVENKSAPCINIDIGGGTSDFLFGEDQEIKCISSSRFASNSIFGSGLTDDDKGLSSSNGIVAAFRRHFEDLLEKSSNDNSVNSLKDKWEAIKDRSPEDLASFFFQLKDMEDLKNNSHLRQELDFERWLTRNEICSDIILVFYMTLIYYAANMIKTEEINEPSHIYFSGNGAKILKPLTQSQKVLQKLTKNIIESVLGREYGEDGLEIIIHGGKLGVSPKTATSVGGILALEGSEGKYKQFFNASEIDKKTRIWLGTGDNSQKHLNPEDKDKYISAVEEQVQDFASVCKKAVAEVSQEESLQNAFGVSDDFDESYFDKDVFRKHIQTYAKTGFSKSASYDQNKIYSSFFFYPITAMLHNLAEEVE